MNTWAKNIFDENLENETIRSPSLGSGHNIWIMKCGLLK
jgi:hypothetical protein